MNKRQLIAALSTQMQIADAEAQCFIDAFQHIVTEALSNGDDVSLIGFGRFYTKQQRARISRHPVTGEAHKLPAKIRPAFSPGKKLKERVCHETIPV